MSVTRQEPVQRIDAFIDFLNTPVEDSVLLSVAYTRVLAHHHQVSGTVNLIEPSLETSGDRGIGDSLVQYSYVPNQKLSANPWIPRGLGSGVALILPTGDFEEGTSVGAYVILPTFGMIFDLKKGFFLLPSLTYAHSFGHRNGASQFRAWEIDLQTRYVHDSGFWSAFSIQYLEDLESSVDLTSFAVEVGQKFTKRFGMSLEYDSLARGDIESDPRIDEGFDQRFALNFAIVF